MCDMLSKKNYLVEFMLRLSSPTMNYDERIQLFVYIKKIKNNDTSIKMCISISNEILTVQWCHE